MTMDRAVECTHCRVVMTSWSAPGSPIRYYQCPFCARTHSSPTARCSAGGAGARLVDAPAGRAVPERIPMASAEDIRWARREGHRRALVRAARGGPAAPLLAAAAPRRRGARDAGARSVGRGRGPARAAPRPPRALAGAGLLANPPGAAAAQSACRFDDLWHPAALDGNLPPRSRRPPHDAGSPRR